MHYTNCTTYNTVLYYVFLTAHTEREKENNHLQNPLLHLFVLKDIAHNNSITKVQIKDAYVC